MDLATQISKQQKKYIDMGAKSGKQGLPPSSAHPYDLNETQLVAEARRLSQEHFHSYKSFVDTKSKSLSDIENGLSAVVPVCDAVLENQDLSFTASQIKSGQKSNLVKLAEKSMKLRAEVKSFCIINNITEEAVYPERPATPYFWILPILLAETFIGASFYENANGLIGGALVAFAVSLLNVGLAFSCEALFRYKNLRVPFQRIGGWLCLLASIVLGLFLNTLFASYRGEYQLLSDPSDPHQLGGAFLLALDSAKNVFLLHSPASDLSSFTLFFLGLAGFFFAFYKGMHVSDRYPGYGPRMRRLKEAELAFDEHSNVVKEKVHAELNVQKESLAKAKNTLMQAKPAVDQVRLALSNAHREMRTQQSGLQQAFELVLTSYRETNVAVRPNDAPGYFGEMPNLVQMAIEDNGEDLTSSLLSIEARIESLKKIIRVN